MSSQLKPIKLWGKGGVNAIKIEIMLKELDLPHEIIEIPYDKVKEPDYIAINPNGRLPTIYDPNTDIKIWESGAIIEYLVEQYDKSHKLSFPTQSTEHWHARQWLYYQASGHGPYYGQAIWFRIYHLEDVPSAKERYSKEICRVTGVLEGHLAQQKQKYGNGDEFDGPWLVGNKFSYADISFLRWQVVVGDMVEREQFNPDDYPHVKEWLANMLSRSSVKESL